MTKSLATQASSDFLSGVRQLVTDALHWIAPLVSRDMDALLLVPPTMLHAAMAAQLTAGGALPVSRTTLERACAATEMANITSLCHENVIDNDLIRRARPARREVAPHSAAILVGDLLLCEAMGLLLDTRNNRYLAFFLTKVREVCRVQVERQLETQGRPSDQRIRLQQARGRTGSLFSFVGHVCGGDDAALSAALEEAGYCVGTACELADDLPGATRHEGVDRGTLDGDVRGPKSAHTEAPRGAQRSVRDQVRKQCSSALDCLKAWPPTKTALAQFVASHLIRGFDQWLPKTSSGR